MSNSAETWRGKAGLLMQHEFGHRTGYSRKTDVLLLWIEASGNGKGPKSLFRKLMAADAGRNRQMIDCRSRRNRFGTAVDSRASHS